MASHLGEPQDVRSHTARDPSALPLGDATGALDPGPGIGRMGLVPPKTKPQLEPLMNAPASKRRSVVFQSLGLDPLGGSTWSNMRLFDIFFGASDGLWMEAQAKKCLGIDRGNVYSMIDVDTFCSNSC